jgi:hypothetical protein
VAAYEQGVGTLRDVQTWLFIFRGKFSEAAAARLDRDSGREFDANSDFGAALTGRPRKALQYEIGNQITASQMTRYQLPAALYAPLRLVL